MIISHSLPSWLLNRSSGVLLHPSALPGQSGIGSLGKESRLFIDFLESAGFHTGKLVQLVRLDSEIHPIRYFVQVLVIHILSIGIHWLILVYLYF